MRHVIFVSLLCSLTIAANTSAFAAWESDPSHTHIHFEVGHLGLTKTPGIFKKFTSSLEFDENNIEASKVAFAIDADSVDTANQMRDEALRGSEWLDAKKSPRIIFTSKSIRHVEGRRYLISGDLTIRGITKKVEFESILIDRTTQPWLKVPVIGFDAMAKIKRSDFGMNSYLGAISDDVDIGVSLEIIKKQ